jgi:hypothetical protein
MYLSKRVCVDIEEISMTLLLPPAPPEAKRAIMDDDKYTRFKESAINFGKACGAIADAIDGVLLLASALV